MKLYNVVQIKAEDFPEDDRQAMERLVNILNPFMQQVVELADGRIDFDNTTDGYKEFDITVNGRTVVSRKGGLLAKLLGRPWPEDDEVLAAVREAMDKPK